MVLYRNLKIHHVFGANTDVGKTVFSTLLTLASVAANRNTFYLKPVSTGPLVDADDRCVGYSCSLDRVLNPFVAFTEATSPATCLITLRHMSLQNVYINSKMR